MFLRHLGIVFKRVALAVASGVTFFRVCTAAEIPVVIQTNTNLRIMAANLNGNTQSYQPFALRIFQGLKPDVVCIQEFNYGDNSTAAMRSMVDTAFGTDFVYYREPYTANGNIPNGVISRYPIIASGSWDDGDNNINDRGFAWAQIDLPGTNDLYAVSVHLKASSSSSDASRRAAQVAVLKSLIESNFPANAWIIVAGDMNLYSDTEPAITNLTSFLSDNPIPTDQNSDADTNKGRSERYDRVLPSFSLTNTLAPVVIGANQFSKGLVFDSRVYTPLNDVSPVLAADSGDAQHMAVLKAFTVNYTVTNFVTVDSPELTFELPGILRWQGVSNLTYSVLSSTNLMDWDNIGAATSTTSFFSFTNSINESSERFYRLTYP